MGSSVKTGLGRRPVIIITALVVLAVLAGIWFWIIRPTALDPVVSTQRRSAPPGMAGPGTAATISVVPVTQGAFSVVIRAVGTVTSYNTVTVVPQVEGRLSRVRFREGARVKAGELLAELDSRSVQASLAEAQGQHDQNEAQLESARHDLVRYENLYKQDSIALQQLETQRALVRQLEGRSVADRAKIESALVQLTHTGIMAPVDGRVGLLKVNVGSMIGPGTTSGLVSIVQTNPISVLFNVPEVQLQSLWTAVADAGPRALKVEAWDRSERQKLAEGHVDTLDNQIDAATGSLRVRARFSNPDEKLFPNQFVNVRLHLRTLADALSVPVDTVQFGNQGTYVYVIRNNRAHVQPVTLGVTTDDRVEILDGLKLGDQVALEGLDRLRQGASVRVVSPLGSNPSGKSDEPIDGKGEAGKPGGAGGMVPGQGPGGGSPPPI